jgi:hypothetical protein
MEELKNTESKQPGISFDFSNGRISIHRTTLRVMVSRVLPIST